MFRRDKVASWSQFDDPGTNPRPRGLPALQGAHQDSNLEPTDPESAALPVELWTHRYENNMDEAGLEPATFRVKSDALPGELPVPVTTKVHGQREIRTLDVRIHMLVFETSALDHSAICPFSLLKF